MECKFCKTKLADDAIFCPECGKQVRDPDAAPEVVAEVVAPAKNPGKVLGIISMILGIVALVVCGPLNCCCGVLLAVV